MRTVMRTKSTIYLLTLIVGVILLAYFPNIAQARSGCCSYHGGVAGCDTSVGRQVCNDGTYSPSCTCAYIPRTPTPTIRITSTPTIFVVATPTPTPRPISTLSPTYTPTLSPTSTSSLSPSPSPEVKGETTEGRSALDWIVGAGIGSFVLWRLIKWIDSKAPDTKSN